MVDYLCLVPDLDKCLVPDLDKCLVPDHVDDLVCLLPVDYQFLVHDHIEDLCLVPDNDQCLIPDLSDNLVLPDHVDDPSLCPGQTRQAGLDNLENNNCFMSDASSNAWQNSDSSKCFVCMFVVDIVHTLQAKRLSTKMLSRNSIFVQQ